MTSLPSFPVPVVSAPMAGGTTTTDLVIAVSRAGGLGLLAGGYLTGDALREQISTVRSAGIDTFGVNLFVPGRSDPNAQEGLVASYAHSLQKLADELGVQLPQPDWGDDDHYTDKVAVVEQEKVPVVTFTFGVPDADTAARLHAAGCALVVTVTDADEAISAARAGADALCLQGAQAGGHRSTHHVGDIPNDRTWQHLFREVESVCALPIIVAGGVMSAADTRKALELGAVAVQCGTAFLLSDEAGTSAAHRAALSGRFGETSVTRAFSGRPARAIRNRFVAEYDASAPAVYPQVNHLTRTLRKAATARGDADLVSAWAGTGWQDARGGSAADLVAHLAP